MASCDKQVFNVPNLGSVPSLHSGVINLKHFFPQLLGTMFENGAMDIVMHYIDLQKSNDTRLTFDGLKVQAFTFPFHYHIIGF